jgi:hypothetical protein
VVQANYDPEFSSKVKTLEIQWIRRNSKSQSIVCVK